MDRGCSIEGCPHPHEARGWCRKHYRRWRTHGDPLHRSVLMGEPPEVRFWAKVDKGGPDECWHWTASLNANGYGVLAGVEGKDVGAHRFSYLLANGHGSIPGGYEVDHTCHNADLSCPGSRDCAHRSCVNPVHLEAVTRQENIWRANEYRVRAKPQAELPPILNHVGHGSEEACPNGHPYDEQNTYLWGVRRMRLCRMCHRENQRRYRAAKRAKAAG